MTEDERAELRPWLLVREDDASAADWQEAADRKADADESEHE